MGSWRRRPWKTVERRAPPQEPRPSTGVLLVNHSYEIGDLPISSNRIDPFVVSSSAGTVMRMTKRCDGLIRMWRRNGSSPRGMSSGGRQMKPACTCQVVDQSSTPLVVATVGTTMARYFGRRHHGAIRSSLTRMGVMATGLGPLVFGFSYRLTSGYNAALILFAAICLPIAVASVWLAPPERRYQ